MAQMTETTFMGTPACCGLAGEIVSGIEPITEAHPAAILGQLLVAFGNAVGPCPYFRAEQNKHQLNLFLAVVGQTAKARKGTAWGHVLQLMSASEPEWASTRITSGLSSGEGLIHAVRDPYMADPGSRDKRLLVVETELGGALRAGGRTGSTLFPTLRQAWDGGTLRVLTRTTSAVATGAHVSVIGHITEDELRTTLSKTEIASGLANRFLWSSVNRVRLLPNGGRLDKASRLRFVKQLRRSLEFGREQANLRFTRRASRLWGEMYENISTDVPGVFGLATSRAEAQVRRMAAVYAMLDRAESIKAEHLWAAEDFWKYCQASAQSVFGFTSKTNSSEKLRAILDAHPGGVSITEISAGLGNHVPSHQLQKQLADLKNSGFVRSETKKTGGRPRTLFYRIEKTRQRILHER